MLARKKKTFIVLQGKITLEPGLRGGGDACLTPSGHFSLTSIVASHGKEGLLMVIISIPE